MCGILDCGIQVNWIIIFLKVASEQKYKELEKYLKYWFSLFTKEEKKAWVEDNIDLLEILDNKVENENSK